VQYDSQFKKFSCSKLGNSHAGSTVGRLIDLYSGVEQLSLPPFVPSCRLLLVGFWLHCVTLKLRDNAATARGQQRRLVNFDAA